MSELPRIITLLIVSIAAAGCTSTKVRLPAKPSPAPQGHQRVALMGIRGSNDMAQAVHEDLVVAINAAPNYQLVEVPSAALLSRNAAPTPLPVKLQQGRMLRANLLLEGTIKSHMDNNGMSGSISFGDPTLVVTFTAKLFDVETGQIAFNDSVTQSMKDDFDSDPTSFDSVEGVSVRLAKKCAEIMTERITGNAKPIELELASARFGKGASHLRRGIEAAQESNWPLAQGYFQRALDEDPDSHEALYNLGVTHEALGQYANAVRHYKSAAERKDSGTYRAAARRAQRAEQEIILAMAKAQRTLLAQRPHHPTAPASHHGGPFFAGPPVHPGPPSPHFAGHPGYPGPGESKAVRRLPPIW
jgi:tetratricopeptide (TPR) repeat protein